MIDRMRRRAPGKKLRDLWEEPEFYTVRSMPPPSLEDSDRADASSSREPLARPRPRDPRDKGTTGVRDDVGPERGGDSRARLGRGDANGARDNATRKEATRDVRALQAAALAAAGGRARRLSRGRRLRRRGAELATRESRERGEAKKEASLGS